MADRIRIKTLENNNVHFNTHRNNYTLCGLETGGDPGLGIEYPVKTQAPVDCPDCIQIVKFCHKIKKNEFV